MSEAMPGAGNWAIDPVDLAAELIRRPSVTPRDEGALDVVASRLERLGFVCHRLVFNDPGPDGAETAPIANLYARFGTGRPNLCFAGHTDVVPPGPTEGWSFEPWCRPVPLRGGRSNRSQRASPTARCAVGAPST